MSQLQISQALVNGKVMNPYMFGIGAIILSPIWMVVSLIGYVVMATNKQRSQWLISGILPRLMGQMDKALKRVKKELFQDIKGRDVIDVGCGSGQYLKYFGECKSVLELEPNPFLRDLLMKNVNEFTVTHPACSVHVHTGFVSDLNPKDHSFDACVLGNVCCEIPNVPQVLKEIDGLLRPLGKVYFIEHVRHDGFWGTVQDLWNPIWCKITDGCNCNRNTLDIIRRVPGWQVDAYEVYTPAPWFVNKIVVGVAVKSGGVAPPRL